MIGPVKLEVYTFVDDETRQPVHIDVGELTRFAKLAGFRPILCEMAESLVNGLKSGSLGVEEPHALKLPDDVLELPLLICEWGDTHIVADGAHRLWRRWKRGDKQFRAYVVPSAFWRAFTIPNELVGGDAAYWEDFNRNAQVR